MQVTINNHGKNTIRVIVDKDTINDSYIQPGQAVPVTSKDEGTIELRELGGVQSNADTTGDADEEDESDPRAKLLARLPWPRRQRTQPRKKPRTPQADWLQQCQPLTEYFEGCYLLAYPDPVSQMADSLVAAGVWYDVLNGAPIPSQYATEDGDPWTCGFGQTGEDVYDRVTWTQDYADMRLDDGLNDRGDFVDSVVTVPLESYQKAALVDFVYNEGEEAFQNSTMLRLLNEGDYDGAADQFPEWDIAGGQVNECLVKRRAAEQQLFLTGSWSPPA
jgi:lysozyme